MTEDEIRHPALAGVPLAGDRRASAPRGLRLAGGVVAAGAVRGA
ncbi:hypothetical protein AB0F30_36790 [Streptomyces sp. NPDC029006]